MFRFWWIQEGQWDFSPDLWAALTTASGGAFGAHGMPLTPRPPMLSPDLFPDIARVVNRMLAHPKWNDLLRQLNVCAPAAFAWAPSVLITSITPEEAETLDFWSRADHQLTVVRQRALVKGMVLQHSVTAAEEAKQRAEAHLIQITEEQAQRDTLQTAKIAKLAEKQRVAREKKIEQSAALREASVQYAINDTTRTTAELAEAETVLQAHLLVVDALPTVVNPQELTEEQLRALLGETFLRSFFCRCR